MALINFGSVAGNARLSRHSLDNALPCGKCGYLLNNTLCSQPSTCLLHKYMYIHVKFVMNEN